MHRWIKWATTWQNQQNGCASSEDSDQPGHPPSLIRVFAARMKKPWVLSYPLSALRRPRLIWVFAGRTLVLLVLSCRGSNTLWVASIWFICNNDYGVNIGQVTSSRLCRRCTNLHILSGISGVSRNNQNGSKISILGSQKSKKVTKILHSHQWNLYQFYQNKIL